MARFPGHDWPDQGLVKGRHTPIREGLGIGIRRVKDQGGVLPRALALPKPHTEDIASYRKSPCLRIPREWSTVAVWLTLQVAGCHVPSY